MNRFSAPPLGLSHPLAYGGLRTNEGKSQWRLSTVQVVGTWSRRRLQQSLLTRLRKAKALHSHSHRGTRPRCEPADCEPAERHCGRNEGEEHKGSHCVVATTLYDELESIRRGLRC